jgi:hypothetical protein
MPLSFPSKAKWRVRRGREGGREGGRGEGRAGGLTATSHDTGLKALEGPVKECVEDLERLS